MDSGSYQAQHGASCKETGDNANRDRATNDKDASSSKREFARYSNYYNDDHFGYENENDEPPISQVVNEGPVQSSHEGQENGEKSTRIDDCQTQFGGAKKILHGQQTNGCQNMKEQNIGQQQQNEDENEEDPFMEDQAKYELNSDLNSSDEECGEVYINSRITFDMTDPKFQVGMKLSNKGEF
ncbi:hypothetical protein ACH5RR_016188 [Cinchona calisaya]|uniref:Uncharacterized protein n=1 Tax=Cinchona calisaya TaxID=153742 RepID=A0ABD2ZW67_9GENT